MLSVASEPSHFLRRVLLQLRWVTIAALLLITVAQSGGATGLLPEWILVLLFAGYNLVVELLRTRLSHIFSFTWLAILDLPVAGLLYLVAAEAGGPLFVLFVLAVDSAAAGMTLRGTLLYTAAVAVVAAVIDSTFPLWAGTPMDLRRLGARLIMLVLVGAGMAIVMRRLILEQRAAGVVRDEAERLEELERLRTGFISTVSHDLRTPLTATRAGLGILETSISARLSDDERELLDTARRNTELLNVLIDDLLAFNQIAAGTLRLDREQFDLRVIVTGAISVVHPLIREKGQVLEVDLGEPLPTEGDPRRLEQVVVNLLANAHRHTPPGTCITLSGRVMDRRCILTVSDTGGGIPLAEQEAIFQRFYRVGGSTDGSGLGLAIARAIVELHAGRIEVESQPGKGTRFRVSLPYIKGGEAV